MVKKLIKYEFIAYARTMLPMILILFGVSLLNRFVQLFENRSEIYSIVFGSSVAALVITMLVCVFMTVFVGITRFYKNLFTLEGYLSFTLPVTASQHIFVKVLVATVFSVVSLAAILLSASIATFGEVLVEVFKAINYLAKEFFAFCGALNGTFYIIEAVVFLLVATISGFMLFYACIAIGQLAKKNRVLSAFGTYFAYYFICQILGTILITLVVKFYDYLPIEQIADFIYKNPFESIHIGLCLFILWEAVLGVVYYLITDSIIKKRLNLE
ncbi:MAG: hypothetical protein UHN02_03545 [Acutalibacteraceae bacterium]|nr:hypothetical protein [Acutalibacteraceae bacterium]